MADLWETIRGGLDSLAWVLNNVHNHETEDWQRYLRAAKADRERALEAITTLKERLENAELLLSRIDGIVHRAEARIIYSDTWTLRGQS